MQNTVPLDASPAEIGKSQIHEADVDPQNVSYEVDASHQEWTILMI